MTVDEYLRSLPEDRREAMKKVRALVKKNLPKGYREHVGYNMITYDLPLHAIATIVASTPPEAMIARHESVHAAKRKKKKK